MNINNMDNLLNQAKQSIRNERVALNLTQKEFALMVGLKYPTYRAFEQTGKISFESFIQILIKLNKDKEFVSFLNSFEFDIQQQRARANDKEKSFVVTPIISPSQKQIVLDKDVFGHELFYSVENGHIYDVSTFISIILNNCTDKNLMYFGEKRLKPYILKTNNLTLLEKFNKHISHIQKLGKIDVK
jgi:transcriptional regulator with XRE-family HTH domain